MEQSQFEKVVTQYQERVSLFQSRYPTQELQEAANDYPVFILPYPSSVYDEKYTLTQTEFAWICNNLTLYNVAFQGNNRNYSLLKKQTQLRILTIAQVNLKDISWISALPNLTNLHLEKTHIVDISALANCKKLKSLSLLDNDIEDISPIATCHQLQYLDLMNNPIKDIAVLANFKALERLYISLHYINSIELLTTLPNLQYLNIAINPSISLAPLSQLHSLTNFSLLQGIVDDSYNFPLIPNLIHLDISNNKFTKLPPLPDKLEYINISYNQITDISPIADLAHLKEFYINRNPITTPPPPCLLSPLCFPHSYFNFPYGLPNKAIPTNAQEIWALLISTDPINSELAAQLMIAFEWDDADADAYTRIAKKIRPY
jgi:Leucine-rich repeat (LRR) protein